MWQRTKQERIEVVILAPVVQRMDDAIGLINHYSVDECRHTVYAIHWTDLSGGQRYPSFKKQRPEKEMEMDQPHFEEICH